MDKTLIVLIALTVFGWLWLWFMMAKPEPWSRFVNRENDFWVSRGIISASLSERIRRFEKGRGQKILVGSGAAFGTVLLLFIRFLM